MPTERITSLEDPRVAVYRGVPDPDLLREHGVFVAEGRHVVRTLLLASPFGVRSVLVSPAALDALSDALAVRVDVPVYVAPQELLTSIVGFNVHRGCLAAGSRPAPRPPDEVMRAARSSGRILVVERIANADNMGSLFRNAAAFGVGGILLSPRCCDPLYRKAIRVSIGATLRLPFATVDDWPRGLDEVRRSGFSLLALTPSGAAPELDTLTAAPGWPDMLALMVGHEGDGLSPEALAAADVRARLAMAPGIDSVNVATAAGIALYVVRRRP